MQFIHFIMVTDVYLVYNDDLQIKKIGGTYTLKVSPFFHFIDDRSYDGRKQAFKLKGSYGAKQTPFAVCMDKEKPVKAFYSESEKDVVKSLIKYLNEENK